MTLFTILILVVAYLIGSLPSAHIAGRYYGVNLRQLGDGNLGARNTYRVLGWNPAIFVGVLDISKGAFATWLASALTEDPLIPYIAALAAAIGHDFSIFIRFAGGQGMAAILGGMLVLQPHELLLGLGAVALCLLILRNWDLSWSLGMGSILVWGWHFGRPDWQLVWVAIIFVSIGLKKLIDLPLVHRIRERHP
ncbi:MAG: glycerol-3-phosphate acyltransferase [Chloroflexota bacterium]